MARKKTDIIATLETKEATLLVAAEDAKDTATYLRAQIIEHENIAAVSTKQADAVAKATAILIEAGVTVL